MRRDILDRLRLMNIDDAHAQYILRKSSKSDQAFAITICSVMQEAADEIERLRKVIAATNNTPYRPNYREIATKGTRP